jgi:hypothetical protein
MKKYYIIWIFFFASSLYAQNKEHDTILFKDIELDNHQLFFGLENIASLEEYLGRLEKKASIPDNETRIPLANNQLAINDFSNNNVMLFTTKDSAFVHYINFEKSKKKITLKFKQKKTTLSNNYKLFQFKKTFPNSYKFAKGINATPLSRAAFIPVSVIRSNYKGYICFTFYDSKLIDIFLSDNEPETPY